jgi:hypothetical protein
MRQHGIVSREMLAFEWPGFSGTEEFSEINRAYLR